VVLLGRRLRASLWQLGAFTLAHSVAFAATFWGSIAVPLSFAQPLIALSIVYVAVGNTVRPDVNYLRVALLSIFGLLHGVQFAGALHQVALPPSERLLGLCAIVLGVQAAQAGLVLLAAALAGGRARRPEGGRPLIAGPACALVVTVELLWAVAR
jgi:hypothetical protein